MTKEEIFNNNAEKIATYCEENRAKFLSEDDQKKYQQFVDSRKPKVLSDLPGKVAESIKTFVTGNKIKSAKLTGSYFSGDWIDSETPEWFKEMALIKKGKNKDSDIDLCVDNVFDDKVFDLFPLDHVGLLIFENGNFI